MAGAVYYKRLLIGPFLSVSSLNILIHELEQGGDGQTSVAAPATLSVRYVPAAWLIAAAARLPRSSGATSST